jgi:uncharacterized membrane protein YebE (DUF533 family)
MRARNLGLATVLALLAMLIPATAGVALGHHATVVVAQITCNGNVAYTVNDWTTNNANHQAQASFTISYAANGGTTWNPPGATPARST